MGSKIDSALVLYIIIYFLIEFVIKVASITTILRFKLLKRKESDTRSSSELIGLKRLIAN